MLALVVCCLTAMAQDVIVKKDGSSLVGKVVEVTDTEVKYRKADNPDGPLYTIKIVDLMRINYENGQSDILSQDGMVPSTVLPGATGDVKDTELLSMYNRKQSIYSLPKKLKLIGFIGGGAMIAVGAIMMICSDWVSDTSIAYTGVGVASAGVIFMPTMYFIAKHKEKKINELTSAPLFRQEIFSKDGKSLSMGVDFMADRVQTRTFGLGMTFNF